MRALTIFLAAILSGCGNSGSSGSSSVPGVEIDVPAPPVAIEATTTISASRTSGVAPLAVYFSATTDPGLFLSGEYHWDFGDPNSGIWIVSGRSKNTETGPTAGHVYETPGSYVVTLTSGQSVSTSAITVSDPDVIFTGTATRCFSKVGNFSGAPAGAQLITTGSLSVVASNIASGRRLLLHRGETWSAFASLTINVAGPGTLGAYGSGNAPKILLTGNQDFLVPSGSTPRLNDWRFMDWDIDGNNGSKSRGLRANGTCNQVLLLRLSARNVHGGFVFATSQLELSNPPQVLYDQIAIVDCVVNKLVPGLGGYGSMFAGTNALFLGNQYDLQGGGEHVLRAQLIQGGVFSHCDLANPSASKSVVKLHGPPFSSGVWAGRSTEKVSLQHNIFRGGLASWTVVTGPEDDHTDQRVRTVLIEGNHFIAGPQQQVAAFLSCNGLVARNNLVNMTGGLNATAFWASRRGIEPIPSNIWFFHNTAYTNDPDRFTVVLVSSATGTIVSANLGSAPMGISPSIVSGSVTVSDNMLNPIPSFISLTPSLPADFNLANGSPALDAATPIPEVWDDYFGTARLNIQDDIGAFER